MFFLLECFWCFIFNCTIVFVFPFCCFTKQLDGVAWWGCLACLTPAAPSGPLVIVIEFYSITIAAVGPFKAHILVWRFQTGVQTDNLLVVCFCCGLVVVSVLTPHPIYRILICFSLVMGDIIWMLCLAPPMRYGLPPNRRGVVYKEK